MKFLILLFCFLVSQTLTAQSFQYTGLSSDSIKDNATIRFPIQVTVPQTAVDTVSFGIESVCLTLKHTYLSDLTIKLFSPDSTSIVLMAGNGGSNDNLTNTCFYGNSTRSIGLGTPPYIGAYQPMNQLGLLNNGQQPTGIWILEITDSYTYDEGILDSVILNFSNHPATYFSFHHSNLPIVTIQTNGQTIADVNKVNVSFKIIDHYPQLPNYLTDSATVYDSYAGIEYRGSFSSTLPQKSFAFELRDSAGNEQPTSLLGMPAESDWNLIACYNDKSFSRNILAMEMFRDMGHYSVRSRLVDVVVDSLYQGIYLLTEKIKRDSNRVDISKLTTTDTIGRDLTGGYMFKVDYWDYSDSWASLFSPIGYPGYEVRFVYDYPKPEWILPVQKDYIQRFVDTLETALYAPNFEDPLHGYRKYIDLTSFIDYFLVNEVARNVDGFKKSCFFHKDKDAVNGQVTKLNAGPVWDFDWAFKDIDAGSENGSGFHYATILGQDITTPGWYIRLLQDSFFVRELHCRYANLRDGILSQSFLNARIDSIANRVYSSQKGHYLTWGNLSVASGTPEVQAPPLTFEEEIQRLKDWLTRRFTWLDVHLPGSTIDCSLGTLNPQAEGKISVFPVPFEKEISFESALPIRAIQLTDLSGSTVYDTEFREPLSKVTIRHDLAKGIYLARISTERGVQTIRIVKQ